MPMRTQASTGKIRQTYEFIKANRKRFDVRTMCRVLEVAPSGYYAWLQEPVCERALEDVRLLRLIRASFAASHGIYGAPRVFLDLREAGETCSKHRVMRLMRVNKIRAVRGYRIRHSSASKPSELIPNILQRNFDVASPEDESGRHDQIGQQPQNDLKSHNHGVVMPHRHYPEHQLSRSNKCAPQGKRGDLIVLDRDIFAIDPFGLHDKRVMATYFDGREVYAAKAK
jgi:hypothetical protein